jgi:putative phosphoribosyl transferase
MDDKFRDRTEAGQLLAGKLAGYANRKDVIALALPRGGVPVGFEVARAIHAPLDVFVVRKLGVPGREELAMGAIAYGVLIIDRDVVEDLAIPPDVVTDVAAQEEEERLRREKEYRGDRPEPDVRGRTVILVDDGLATGSTMQAAVAALRKLHPARVVVAVPVAAASACAQLAREVDEIVCAHTPDAFHSVGQWYEEFGQTTDEEVRALLARAQRETPQERFF